MYTKIVKNIINLLILCLVTTNVLAISITPGRTLLEFTPGLEQTITVNVGHVKEKDAIVYIEGELAEYITLSEELLHFTSNEQTKEVKYTIKLPNTIGKPGIHRTRIIAREVAPQTREGEIVVQALLAVSSGIDIRVPYPGKYVVADLYVPEQKEEVIPLVLQSQNLGKEDIKSLQATIDLLTEDEKIVASTETEVTQLEAGKKTDLKATIEVPTTYDQYIARATIHYDGLTTTTTQRFQTGEFGLQPIDISVKDFTLGSVAKFNILVKNRATKAVQEATAQIQLRDEERTPVADFVSQETGIPATAVKALIAYWDTEIVEAGSYEGILTLTADEATTEKRLKTTITQDEIRTEFLDITGKAISTTTVKKTKILNTQSSIALLAGIIVLANLLGWYVYRKRKDKEKLMEDF